MGWRLVLGWALAVVATGVPAGKAGPPETKKRSSSARDLAELAQGGKPLDRVRLEIFWNYGKPRPGRGPGKFDVHFVIHGEGYGYLNDTTEFPVTPDQVRQMLKWLDE